MQRFPWILVALFLAGAVAAAYDASRRAGPRTDPEAPWVIWNANDEPVPTTPKVRPTLGFDQSITLADADRTPRTIRGLMVLAVPSGTPAILELRWCAENGAEWVVTLAHRRASLGYRERARGPITAIAEREAPADAPFFEPKQPLSIDAQFSQGRLSLRCNDTVRLNTKLGAPEGRVRVTARAPSWELRGLSLSGMLPVPPGAPPQPWSLSTDLTDGLPPSHLRAFFARFGVCLAGALLLMALLRLVCAGRPERSRLVRATGRLLAPAAAVTVVVVAAGGSPSLPVVVGASFLGLLPALFTLRDHLGRAELEPVPKAWPLLGLVALVFAAGTSGGMTGRFHAAERQHEARSLGRPEPAAWNLGREVSLGPENALPIPGSRRDVSWSAKVVLESSGILQFRTRGAAEGKPYGVSLFLSADPQFESGFFEEGRIAFDRIGPAAGIVTASRPLDVRVDVRGRTFEATVDGVAVAKGSCRRNAHGSLTLLAARGRATVQSSSVDPVNAPISDADAPARLEVPAWPDQVEGGAMPLLFLAAYVLLLRRPSRIPAARAFGFGALALLPLTSVLPTLAPTGPPDAPSIAAACIAATTLLLLLPMVHSRALGPLRHAILAILVCGGAVCSGAALLERAWPPTENERNALAFDAWDGERLEPDLLHLMHPLSRRWQNYLGQHGLRNRWPSLAPSPGTTRVLFLGTSSTYGYRARVPYGFHLEPMLRERGLAVESLVGAVEGSSGARLFHILENVLMDYSPDVLCLSLGFNDSIALAQLDERAYLERVTAPGYRRGLIDRWRTHAGLWFARRQLAGAMEAASSVRYDAIGPEGDRPSDRFERIIQDYARFAQVHDLDLVFVKEPINESVMTALTPQQHFVPAFYAAMDRVARAHGARVVDPSPYLDAHGGAALFQDAVHPTDEGHERMAEALLDTLSEVIEAREKRRAGK